MDTEPYNNLGRTDGTDHKSRIKQRAAETGLAAPADTDTACVLICVSYFASQYPGMLLKVVVFITDGQMSRIFT